MVSAVPLAIKVAGGESICCLVQHLLSLHTVGTTADDGKKNSRHRIKQCWEETKDTSWQTGSKREACGKAAKSRQARRISEARPDATRRIIESPVTWSWLGAVPSGRPSRFVIGARGML